jgi:transcriptional regulator with XRE-family HTH domain
MQITQLKLIRIKSGLKQYRLAELASVSPTLLSHYETGRRNCPIEIQKELAKILSVDPKDLFPAEEKATSCK